MQTFACGGLPVYVCASSDAAEMIAAQEATN